MEILISIFITVVFMLFFANYLVTRAVYKCERENRLKNNATFVIVLHKWFVTCKGFTVVYSDAKTIEQARNEAKMLCHDNSTDFSDCAYTVIPVLSSSTPNDDFDRLSEKNQRTHC
jgi:hypothetical protein